MKAIEIYKNKYPISSEYFKSFSKILFSIPPCIIVSNNKRIDVKYLSEIYFGILSHMSKWQNEMLTKKYAKPDLICKKCDLSNFCPGIADYYANFFGVREFGCKRINEIKSKK